MVSMCPSGRIEKHAPASGTAAVDVDQPHPTEDAGATMHGHAHTVDDRANGTRPRAVPARPDDHRLLMLQRMAGNRAVTELVQGGATTVVQRCGGETHAGCPCAEPGGDQATSDRV
jgi:hypothetical protein